MKDIADRVKITAAGLYWHFPSKEDILFTFLDSVLSRLTSVGRQALELETPEAQLREYTRQHVLFQVEQPEASAVYDAAAYGANQLIRNLEGNQRRRLVELQRKHLETLEGILTRGVEQGSFAVPNVAVAAFAIIGMGEHVGHWYRSDGRLTIGNIADQFADYAYALAARGS